MIVRSWRLAKRLVGDVLDILNPENGARRIFLGIGPGRCGTRTLATLIGGCDGCNVHHEWGSLTDATHVLPYEFNIGLAQRKLRFLRHREGDLVGDVASYYLNYVDWFKWQVPRLKVIGLVREKGPCVASWLDRVEREKRAPWLSQGHHWRILHPAYRGWAKWDRAFPKFDLAADLVEAAGTYWEYYTARVWQLAKRYPRSVLVVRTEDLGRVNVQRSIFRFLGIAQDKMRLRPGIHENKGPLTLDREARAATGGTNDEP